MFFGFLPFTKDSYSEHLNSLLCSGDARKVELYLTKTNYHTKNLLLKNGITEVKELSSLLAKLLNIDPSKRPSIEEILGSDAWI
jgi:serine/threonine protein kinase